MASSISFDNKEDTFTTCSSCSKAYDNDKHGSKGLPCLHTCCISCLKGQEKITCPQCHTAIAPATTVDSLPNNFTVDNLKMYQDILNSEVSCGNCSDDGNKAITFCHDCHCFLCQVCFDAHKRVQILRSHKVTTMAELHGKKCNPIKELLKQCEKHTGEMQHLFCKQAACKIPICHTCSLVDHHGHGFEDLIEVANTIATDLKQSSANLKNKKSELSKNQKAIDDIKETLTANFTAKQKAIQESKQNMIDSIDSQYKKTSSHLQNLYETEMKLLTTIKEPMDKLEAQMTTACEFVDQAYNMNQPAQIITLKDQILPRLNVLQTTKLPESTSSSGRTDFAFTNNHKSSEALIRESLLNLYDIDWFKEIREPQFDPQKADPNRCSIRFGRPIHNEGQFMADLQAVNSAGQNVTRGNANFDVRINPSEGLRPGVRDYGSGAYMFKYHKGDRNIHVKLNGVHIRGSPFDSRRPPRY